MKNYVIIGEVKCEVIGDIVQTWPHKKFWSNMTKYKFKVRCPKSFNLKPDFYKHIFKINDEFFSLEYQLIRIQELSSMKNEKIIQIHIIAPNRIELEKYEERDLIISELFD